MFNLKEVRKKKLINERYKAQSSKKWKIDDKLITRIQKDIKDFSKNKFNITNSKSSELKLNNIISFTKNSISKIYLTQLNILKQINPLNKTEKEKEFSKSTKSNLITKKFSIPSDLKVNNSNEIIPYSVRSYKNKNKLSENYIQFNTESNLINDNMNKNKRYNYSYKNPLALIRKEKYKIFERKETNDKNDLIETGLQRIMHGIVHDDLTRRTELRELLDAAAETGTDTRCHDHKCCLFHETPNQ